MVSESKDETDEIIRGFILEKDVIHQEHQKEKDELVDSLMKDREHLIIRFKKQLADIERKVDQDGRTRVSGVRHHSSDATVPIYIQLDGGNVVSAEDFLSSLRFQDRHEIEKDSLERSFREEKRMLRDKLELDYSRKLQDGNFKHDSIVEELRITIKEMNSDKIRLERELRKRTEDFKLKWDSAKASLEANFVLQQNELRNSLERQHGKEVANQRENYERMLKENHEGVAKLMNAKGGEISTALKKVKDYEGKVSREITERLQHEFEKKFQSLHAKNDRLSEQVEKLIREKQDLTGRIKDIAGRNDNKMSILNEFSDRLNKEYEERLKKSILKNEKLRAEVEELRNQNRSKEKCLRDCQEIVKQLEDELLSKQKLLDGHGDCRDTLRTENRGLSQEVDILRREKDEFVKIVEDYKGMENVMKVKISKSESRVEGALDSCKILERERLGLERKMALLGEELQRSLKEKNELTRGLKRADEETLTVKQLLDEERQEHDRLSERFKLDTEEIRKKDNECKMLREKLRNNSGAVESELNLVAEHVSKLMEIEKRNAELQKRLDNFEANQEILLKKERESIQKQFAKEFAKRIQTLRANYEEATEGLKGQVRLSRSKVSELESWLSKRNDNYRTENAGNESYISRNQFGFEESRSKNDHSSTFRNRLHSSNNNQFTDANGRSSVVRVFDHGHKHNQNTKSAESNGIVPVRDRDLSPSLRKKQTTLRKTQNSTDAPGILRQGVFSRQRSASWDPTARNRSQDDNFRIHKFDSVSKDTENIPHKGDYFGGRDNRYGSFDTQLYLPKRGFLQDEEKVGSFKGVPGERTALYLHNQPRDGGQLRSWQKNDAVNGSQCYAKENREDFRLCSTLGDVTGLPPKYISCTGRRLSEVEKEKMLLSDYCYQVRGDPETEKLERSVERLQDKLETSHSELLQKLELMQKSNALYEPYQKKKREEYGEYENVIPRTLLYNIEAELQQDGELVGEKSEIDEKYIDGLTRTALDEDSIKNEMISVKLFAKELQVQLQNKTTELNDTKEALHNVYKSCVDVSNELLNEKGKKSRQNETCLKTKSKNIIKLKNADEIEKGDSMESCLTDAIDGNGMKDNKMPSTSQVIMSKKIKKTLQEETRDRFSDEMSV